MCFARLFGRNNKIIPDVNTIQPRPSIALESIQSSDIHIDIKPPIYSQNTPLSPPYELWKNHIFPFFIGEDAVIFSFTSKENYKFIEKTIGDANLKLLIDVYRCERLDNVLNTITFWVQHELTQYNSRVEKKSKFARLATFVSGITAPAIGMYYGVKKILGAPAELTQAKLNSNATLLEFKNSCQPFYSTFDAVVSQTTAYKCLDTCLGYSWEEKNSDYDPAKCKIYYYDDWGKTTYCAETYTKRCSKFYINQYCSTLLDHPSNCYDQQSCLDHFTYCQREKLMEHPNGLISADNPIATGGWVITGSLVFCGIFFFWYGWNLPKIRNWFKTNEEKICSENLKNSSLFNNLPKDFFTYKTLNALTIKDANITIVRASAKIRGAIEKNKLLKYTNLQACISSPLLRFFQTKIVNQPNTSSFLAIQPRNPLA